MYHKEKENIKVVIISNRDLWNYQSNNSGLSRNLNFETMFLLVTELIEPSFYLTFSFSPTYTFIGCMNLGGRINNLYDEPW